MGKKKDNKEKWNKLRVIYNREVPLRRFNNEGEERLMSGTWDFEKLSDKEKRRLLRFKSGKVYKQEPITPFSKAFTSSHNYEKHKKRFIAELLDREDDDLWMALEYAPYKLRNDKEFILELIDIYPEAIRFASRKLKNDRDVAFLAVEKKGSEIKYVSKSLKKDEELAMIAILQEPKNFKLIDKGLQNSENFSLNAINKVPEVYSFIPKKLSQNERFVAKVISLNPGLEIKKRMLRKVDKVQKGKSKESETDFSQ